MKPNIFGATCPGLITSLADIGHDLFVRLAQALAQCLDTTQAA